MRVGRVRVCVGVRMGQKTVCVWGGGGVCGMRVGIERVHRMRVG